MLVIYLMSNRDTHIEHIEESQAVLDEVFEGYRLLAHDQLPQPLSLLLTPLSLCLVILASI